MGSKTSTKDWDLVVRWPGTGGIKAAWCDQKVHTPKKREPVPFFALYTLDPALIGYHTTGTCDGSRSAMETVGKLVDSRMRFTLTGECVDGPKTSREKHDAHLPSILADACKRKGASASRQKERQSPWEWDGATMFERQLPQLSRSHGAFIYASAASIRVVRLQRRNCRGQ